MRRLWFVTILCYQIPSYHAFFWSTKGHPWIEKYHYPGYYTTPKSVYVNGTNTEIPGTKFTPDYRVEEKMHVVYSSFKKEQEKPYRITPIYKMLGVPYYKRDVEQGTNLGCYCCATYRRHITLAGCAVLTTRHVLTTANPTVLILRSYGHMENLEGILGGWYEYSANTYNSSLYFSVSRIHIHPMYKYDYEVNVSHPIPVMYDLSLWAATYRFYGNWYTYSTAYICPRAGSGWYEYSSTIPRTFDLSVVVGHQFMKSYKRRPLPWHKYAVRTKKYVWPCPKSDWHWYHCIMGEYWGRFGMDSGGAMHMMMEGKSNRHDGLAGMCSFSLKLRAFQTTHYFTVVDTYPVLDFLYDAYLGLKPYAWLDYRFQNTRWGAPIPYWGEYVYSGYSFGWDYYYYMSPLPNYRR
ncbi:uncharacterized protein LOC110380844 [Helicoverpa armigera]|uniref:uncharacterized protein LOC110380844 n=1 Tax=Helicoverpa armigera TaxID=29058 RepID=UPI00211246D9|nr:uncharacterized protein LOC110380844 [Helicoverpa armigera]